MKEEDITSLAQEEFRFTQVTNRSYSDNDGRQTAVHENVNILASYVQGRADLFSTLFANAITHEVGHDLGAIHLRDRVEDYIDGDVMGTNGSSSAPATFVTFAPLVKDALGVPVTDAEHTAIWNYYKKWEVFEKYDHNNAPLPQPGDDPSDLAIGGSVLTVYGGPLVRGGPSPIAVTQADLGSTTADGSGGQSSTIQLHLVNDGDQDLSISDVALRNAGSGFSLEDVGNLPLVIPALDPANPQPEQSDHVITLRFDPARGGRSH